MGVSGGARENIAIEVTTAAELSGTRAARQSVDQLGAATQQAAAEIAEATTQAAAGENTLAAAAVKASQETDKVTVSATQMREALAATGGDLAKAAQLLATTTTAETNAAAAAVQLATAEKEVAVSTDALLAATERKRRAEEAAAATDEKRLRQMTLLHIQALEEDKARSASVATVEKMSPQLRTAANAMSILTQAVTTGTGSMAGLANAAGSLAFGISSLATSAKVAASATGIGALVTVAVALYEAFNRDDRKIGELMDSLDRLSGKSAAAIKAEEERELALFAATNARIAANDKLISQAQQLSAIGAGKVGGGIPIDPGAVAAARRDNEQQIALRNQLEERLFKIHERWQETQASEDERRAEDRKHRLERDAEHAANLEERLGESRIAALDRLTRTEEDAAIQKIIREERRTEQEIRDLEIAEERKTELILLAQEERDERIREIRRDAEKKRREDQEKADEDARRKQEEETKRATDAIMEYVDASADAVDAAIKANESAGEILTKALVAPIVKGLEALAEMEAAKAGAHFLTGDIFGGAAHAAASVLAAAAASKVARQSGLSSSGGGGGAPAAAPGAGRGAFSPNDRDRGGDVVVNLFTTDPFNRENIMIASYQLQRANITNRPIYVPPTTGFRPREN